MGMYLHVTGYMSRGGYDVFAAEYRMLILHLMDFALM